MCDYDDDDDDDDDGDEYYYADYELLIWSEQRTQGNDIIILYEYRGKLCSS